MDFLWVNFNGLRLRIDHIEGWQKHPDREGYTRVYGPRGTTFYVNMTPDEFAATLQEALEQA